MKVVRIGCALEKGGHKMARTTMRNLEYFELRKAFDRLERSGEAPERALRAFHLRVILGRDPETSLFTAHFQLRPGETLEGLLAEVESAWERLEGGNGQV